jgi:hypothetical protein
MTARNDITGDAIRSAGSKNYSDNYDKVKFKTIVTSEMVTHQCSKMGVKLSTVKGNDCKYCGVKCD